MRRFLIVIGITLLILMAAGLLLLPTYRHLRSVRESCLREMAACEQELSAMIPKLKAYALSHKGLFPKSDEELTKALGKPLPKQYLYIGPEFRLIPHTTDDRYLTPIIMDKERHYPYPSRLEEFAIPKARIHMLLNDLTIYHADTENDLT